MQGARREFSAGGVLVKDGETILVQVANLKGEKVWTFPKGHIEAGESPVEAALREVEEETGWRCGAPRPLTRVNYEFSRQGELVSKSVEWFLMDPLEEVGTPDEKEILDCRWVAFADARGLIRYPTDAKLLDLIGA